MATVLVVDDHALNRLIVKEVLSLTEHKVIEAEEANEALMVLKTQRPDLVITDVLMPEMDGFDFVRRLREDPQNANIPVIFYTAYYSDSEARPLADASGVLSIVVKGSDPTVLLNTVNKVLASHHHEVSFSPDVYEREHLRALNQKLVQKVNQLEEKEEALQVSESRFRGVIESSWEGIFLVDEDGKADYVNESLKELLGLSDSQLLGDAWRENLVPYGVEVIERDLAIGNKRNISYGERVEINIPDKGELILDFRAHGYTTDRGSAGVMYVVNDVTAQVQAERRQHELEEREVTDRLRQEFFALVSHEIRTPLTAITGYLQLLSRQLGDLGLEAKYSISLIEHSSHRLVRLVDDLLFSSQIEAGTMSLITAPVDLNTLVQNCHDMFLVKAEKREIDFRLDIRDKSLECFGDPDRLAQVLDNLVDNAIKFTSKGGHVDLRLDSQVEEDGGLLAVIEVEDDGMGISDLDKTRLFQRFVRTESAMQADNSGSGLGLAICKAIVEGHDGVIEVLSEPGSGSLFRVAIPAEGPVEEHDFH